MILYLVYLWLLLSPRMAQRSLRVKGDGWMRGERIGCEDRRQMGGEDQREWYTSRLEGIHDCIPDD